MTSAIKPRAVCRLVLSQDVNVNFKCVSSGIISIASLCCNVFNCWLRPLATNKVSLQWSPSSCSNSIGYYIKVNINQLIIVDKTKTKRVTTSVALESAVRIDPNLLSCQTITWRMIPYQFNQHDKHNITCNSFPLFSSSLLDFHIKNI